MKKICLLICFIAFNLQLFSQLPDFGTGPGGVGKKDSTKFQPQNRIWLRADKGVDLNYNDDPTKPTNWVVNWLDQSGNGSNATDKYCNSTVIPYYAYKMDAAPLLQKRNNLFNNKAYLRFQDWGYSLGSNVGLIIEDLNPSKPIDACEGMFVSIVFQRTQVPDPSNFQFLLNKRCETCGSIPEARAWIIGFDTGTNPDKINFNVNGPGNYYRNTTEFTDTNSLNLYSVNYNNLYPNPLITYLNGRDEAWYNFTSKIFDSPAPLAIVGSNGASVNIPEIIVYRDGLSDAQTKIVHNYLAAKYNLTLRAQQGGINTKFYDAGYGYTEDVIGVGKGFDLTFKPHVASAGGSIILEADTNSLTKITSKQEYVFAGHKMDSLYIDTTNNQVKWSREWWIDVTGSVDVNLYFNFKAAGFDYSNVSSLNEFKLWGVTNLVNNIPISTASIIDANPTIINDSVLKYEVPNIQKGYYTISKNLPVGFGSVNIRKSDIKLLSICPNPVFDILNLYFTNEIEGKVIINVYGIDSKKIDSFEDYKSVGVYTASINTSKITSGLYFIEVLLDNTRETIKFIKE